MGKWLAEYQENTLETGIQTSAKTDRSHDMALLAVPDQGVLEEKPQNQELMACLSDACDGLDMTPEQFNRILNKEGQEQIISGELSGSTLKDYARQIDDAINDGVVNLLMESV